MTKDEFIGRIDNIISDPDNLTTNLAQLRTDVCEDYDALTAVTIERDKHAETIETLTADNKKLKDLSLNLFLSKPQVTEPNDPPAGPNSDPEPPAPETYGSLDDLTKAFLGTE